MHQTVTGKPPIFQAAQIVKIEKRHREYIYMALDSPYIALNALPGQFVMIKLPDADDLILPRPFDIVTADSAKGEIELVIKITGKGTHRLSHKKPGELLLLTGPLGRGITDFTGDSSIGLLVRGVGAAAVVLLANRAKEKGIKVVTFLSASTKERLVCREYLEPLSHTVFIATDDGTEGYRGNAWEMLDSFLDKTALDQIYTCGSRRFARHIKKLDSEGKTRGFVFLEGFMACGMGDCHGCAVKKAKEEGYFLVCQDGPVFPVGVVEIKS
ncbi:MAG: hypothetical protein DRP87_05120 [Spirochaetes bacterium]|nr:MAG: hypothetical protein DRP87_05120 [Spirochaetota bacterium]